MKIPHKILDTLPAPVKAQFLHWRSYMEERVEFGLFDSDIHTNSHCERVLLHALDIGHSIFGDSIDELHVLSHVSIFHDTRRQDDYLDKGHGARAAEYYTKFCEQQNDIDFYPLAYNIMKFHDQEDELGVNAINASDSQNAAKNIHLYRIFKDADALDRFRLGVNGLDPRFLRNQEAVKLMDFAKHLVDETVDKETLQKTVDFALRFSRKLKEE